MDPGADDEPSREELERRVDELEQTVSKMLPDRRGVLKGLGAAALGGAAVGGATGGASGQSAAGQIGTASSPVDVEAADVNAEYVNIDQLSNEGRTPDVVVWTDGTTVYADGRSGEVAAGSDAYTVIDSALTSAGQDGTVLISPGDYTLSDVILPTNSGQTINATGAYFIANSGFSTALSQDYLIQLPETTPDCTLIGGRWDADYPNQTGIGAIWLNGDRQRVLYAEAFNTDSDGGAIDLAITGNGKCLAIGCKAHDFHNREGGLHVAGGGDVAIGNVVYNEADDTDGTPNTKSEGAIKCGAEGSLIIGNRVEDCTEIDGIFVERQADGTVYKSTTTVLANWIQNCARGIYADSSETTARLSANIIRQCSSWGIELQTGDYYHVFSNEIENCQNGIKANFGGNQHRLSNNYLQTITDVGIEVVQRAYVIGNDVYDVTNSHGIHINGATGSVVNDNEVTNVGGSEILVDSTADVRATDNKADVVDSGASRLRYNGTVFLAGTPSEANYAAQDAGDVILDTTASPPDEYRVAEDGTLYGPL